MNKIIISLAFIVSYLGSFGQDSDSFKSSTIYGEFFGNSLNQITINYERVFTDKSQIKIGYRVGASLDGLLFNTSYDRYGILANAFGFTGRKASHFEFGVGISFLKGSFVSASGIPNSTLYLPVNLSYRYQPRGKTIFFRLGGHSFLKLFESGEIDSSSVQFSFGVAAGYSFPTKR